MKVLIDLGDGEFAAKMMIESLCIAQSRIANSDLDRHRRVTDVLRLQKIIDGIEEAVNGEVQD